MPIENRPLPDVKTGSLSARAPKDWDLVSFAMIINPGCTEQLSRTTAADLGVMRKLNHEAPP